MPLYALIYWLILAVSIFNTVVMLWLGLTVLLNAERYTGGVWLMGGGMLAGAAFFVSHTAILGQELYLNSDGLNFWWRVGWIPVIVAPAAWYVVILWYSGFWSQPRSPLFYRHRLWLIGVLVVVVVFGVLLLLANVIPDYDQVIQLNLEGAMRIAGVPVAFLAMPTIMIGCILLSIDALRHPAPTQRLMGEDARRRSRPWLMRAALVLLVISILVTIFIAQIVMNAGQALTRFVYFEEIALFDLALASLIALAAFFIGQAIVSYEVFTGTALPRRGFLRQWRTMLLFAGVYSLFVAWGITRGWRTIYLLLATTLLMVGFYALFNWRAFVERERVFRQIRPFVSSQRLMTGLTSDSGETSSSATELFQTICRQLLNTDRAVLMPLGSIATLVDPLRVDAWAAANDEPPSPDPVGAKTYSMLVASLAEGEQRRQNAIRLDPVSAENYHWLIPLRSDRGLVGALLVGAKRDGGLYTKEEIDLAQAGGERVIDTLAGEHLARRLMDLQRHRLAENRVVDMRTRRTLHDEILPALHTTLLQLSATDRDPAAVDGAIRSLTDAHKQISRLIQQTRSAPVQVDDEVDLVRSLHRFIEGEFDGRFDSVTWETPPALPLPPLVGEVVLGAAWEVIRNAATHGRGATSRPLRLAIRVEQGAATTLTLQDDGVGLHVKPRVTGGGNGLVLHGTLLTVIGGSLSVDSPPEGGTRAIITLP